MSGGVEIKKKQRILAATSLSILVLDRITKYAVSASLHPGEVVEEIPGFFNIVFYRNPGAAFSVLNGGGVLSTLFLIAVSIVALVVIVELIRRSKETLLTFALSMIAGGAAGNLIDRIRYGSVIDFLDLYAGKYHWPAFNVADSAITAGVILAIFSYLRRSE